MFPNVTEIVLILLIIVVIVGMGKLPLLATRLGRLRSEFKRGLEGEEPIDITPEDERPGPKNPQRKPGKFEPTIEEARVEDA